MSFLTVAPDMVTAGARIVLEQVPTVGLLPDDLAGTGAPEPLRGPAVGLGLGHVSSISRISRFCVSCWRASSVRLCCHRPWAWAAARRPVHPGGGP